MILALMSQTLKREVASLAMTGTTCSQAMDQQSQTLKREVASLALYPRIHGYPIVSNPQAGSGLFSRKDGMSHSFKPSSGKWPL